MDPVFNLGQPVVDPQTTFTPEALSDAFQKHRTELIVMPMFAMQAALQHMGFRDGIRYKEHIHEMKGNFQMGNFDSTRRVTARLKLSSAHSRHSLATASSLSTRLVSTKAFGVLTSQKVRGSRMYLG